MNRSLNRFFGGAVAAGIAGAMLVSLLGCGSDVLTWSKEAKAQGIQDYNDGRYAEAAGAFSNAIRQTPTDFESEYWLALSYEQMQSYHESIDAYKTCLRLMPAPGTVYYNAAMHDSAFDRLARIVARFDPTGRETDLIVQTAAQSGSSEDYRLLGWVFRYRGDADSALTNYRHSVQIDPNNFVAQRELGMYLEQLNQNQEAGQVLRDAYRLNQNDSRVNNALRRLGIEPGDSLLAQQPQQQATHPLLLPPDPVGSDPSLPSPAASTDGPAPELPAPRN
jgi:tetratricopeptide (TPR) repeat protein